MVVPSTADDPQWSLYPYRPVKALNALFAGAFFLSACVLLYQGVALYRWKRYTWIMVFACIVWTAAFSVRMASTIHDRNVDLFVAQYIMFFLAPPLFAGAEYFVLGRLLAYLPYHAPIHPGRVLSTFILLDTLVEILASNGASAMATAKTVSQRDSGAYRMQASLFVQLALEIAFMAMLTLLWRRCRKMGTWPRNVRIVSWVLYVTSAMMAVRIVFRIVQGFEMTGCALDEPLCGEVEQHEWFLYVFEVCNIFLFVVGLMIWPPGKYLPHCHKVYLHPHDGTERAGPGFSAADKRPLWQSVFDPFNVHGILTGKGHVVEKFWEREYPLYVRGEPLPESENVGNGKGECGEVVKEVKPRSSQV